jgi:hypothetical protein
MEENLDKCLAFCQALVVSNHQFTFALTIGKDNTFSFSTHDRDHNLKKAARPQSRRERRAADPAVKQKATTYAAKVAAEKVDAEKVAAEKVAAEKVAAEKAAGFNCDQCNFCSTSEQEMEQHKEITHASEQVADDAAAEQAAAGAVRPLRPASTTSPASGEDLSALSCKELRALCKEQRLLTSGNKGALLERLRGPEQLRDLSTAAAKQVSPVKSDGREEPCVGCGAAAALDHQCDAGELLQEEPYHDFGLWSQQEMEQDDEDEPMRKVPAWAADSQLLAAMEQQDDHNPAMLFAPCGPPRVSLIFLTP